MRVENIEKQEIVEIEESDYYELLSNHPYYGKKLERGESLNAGLVETPQEIAKQFTGKWNADNQTLVRVQNNLKPMLDEDKTINFPVAVSETKNEFQPVEVWIADDGRQVHQVVLTEKIAHALNIRHLRIVPE